MRVLINTNNVQDTDTLKSLNQIKRALNGGLGLDNFQGKSVSGVTSGSANTSKLFPHNTNPQPIGGIILFGNVYIHSISITDVDIRSPLADTEFSLFLISGKLEQ